MSTTDHLSLSEIKSGHIGDGAVAKVVGIEDGVVSGVFNLELSGVRAPHIAIDGHLTETGKRRKTAIDERTLRHPGYAISQCCRKRIEEVFGWIKTVAGLAQVKVRGLAKVQAIFLFAIAAYNLVQIPKLLAATL